MNFGANAESMNCGVNAESAKIPGNFAANGQETPID
jgi:hypothetical protein